MLEIEKCEMHRLFEILCVSAAFVANAFTERDGPRSVNLALETSLLFEPKDAYKHLKFIAEARKFLDKLENAISPQKNLRSDKVYLTDFLNELAETLMTFDDDQLHQFFISLEFEMRVHYYKGAIFREIVYDPKLLMYVRNKLKEWTTADPRMMRAKLNKYMLSDRNKDTSLNRLGNFLNAYYEIEQSRVMSEIVEKLRNIDDNDEIGGIIRDGVNTLVIQHYDRMNYTTRAKLADEINKLSDLTKIAKNDVDEDLKLSFRKSLKSDIRNINEVDKNETLFYHNNAELFVKAVDATVVGDENKVNEKDSISIDNAKFKGHEN